MKNLSLKKAEDRHFRLYNEIDFSWFDFPVNSSNISHQI